MSPAFLSSPTHRPAALDRAYRTATLRIIPILFVCYMCNYLDRINVGFAKLQMLDQLRMSNTAFGIGAGVFFVGYVCAGVPSSLVLRRVSPRRWMCIMMLSWGTLSAALLSVKTPESFYVLRFLTGVAEAGFFPSIVLYLEQWFATEHRGRVLSLFLVSIPISGAVGGPLSGWMLDYFAGGRGGLSAWQWLYLLQGAPTVLFGILLLFVLRDRVEQVSWLTDAEKRIVREDLDRDARTCALPAHQTGPTSKVLLDRTVLSLGFVYFCIQMGAYAMNFWLPTIIHALGVTKPSQIGLASAVPYLTASIAMVIVGRSADLRQERRLHLGVPLLAGFLGLLLAAGASGDIRVSMIGLTLATAGTLTGIAMFWPFTSSLPDRPPATGIALINSLGQIAGFVSPYFIGWARDKFHSTMPALYILSSMMAAGALLIVLRPGSTSIVPASSTLETE
ncbi:MFS transporter [Burkholderia contaminans]|uniref:MFS transporter n=1 Tax=Burkholderia contaminans TaxID=488447 RepID=UPI000F586EE8|nr:MFS transporter [Burkholderia contaminans]RQT02074.1 MFS transporter [Burkholderia contaminans]